MLHVFEESQLSVGPFGKEFGLEGPVELFDGHLSSGAAVPRRTDKIHHINIDINLQISKRANSLRGRLVTNFVTWR